jgi:hypothetical protein
MCMSKARGSGPGRRIYWTQEWTLIDFHLPKDLAHGETCVEVALILKIIRFSQPNACVTSTSQSYDLTTPDIHPYDHALTAAPPPATYKLPKLDQPKTYQPTSCLAHDNVYYNVYYKHSFQQNNQYARNIW